MKFNDILKNVLIMEYNIEDLKKFAKAGRFTPHNTRVGLITDAAGEPVPPLDVKAALVNAGMKPDDPLLRDIMAHVNGAYSAHKYAAAKKKTPEDERETT